MYVCICNAVTESQIEQAVHDGARTLADLRRDLGVSAECGSCATYARQCLDRAKEKQRQDRHGARAEHPPD